MFCCCHLCRGGGGFSQALQEAIERANAKDILFILAAGNGGTNNDVTASYPCNYPNANIICVAASTSSGGLASFSQYGAVTVDIGECLDSLPCTSRGVPKLLPYLLVPHPSPSPAGAPGAGIYSTVPIKSGKNIIAGYASYSGTSSKRIDLHVHSRVADACVCLCSYDLPRIAPAAHVCSLPAPCCAVATPHVSGAAALYASVYPGATAAQIKYAILRSAKATNSLAGKCAAGGRLDVAAMLAFPPLQP